MQDLAASLQGRVLSVVRSVLEQSAITADVHAESRLVDIALGSMDMVSLTRDRYDNKYWPGYCLLIKQKKLEPTLQRIMDSAKPGEERRSQPIGAPQC